MLDPVTFPGDAGGVIRGSPIVYCGEPNAREKEMEEKKKRFTKSWRPVSRWEEEFQDT